MLTQTGLTVSIFGHSGARATGQSRPVGSIFAQSAPRGVLASAVRVFGHLGGRPRLGPTWTIQVALGEGTNLRRFYGKEQLYAKISKG